MAEEHSNNVRGDGDCVTSDRLENNCHSLFAQCVTCDGFIVNNRSEICIAKTDDSIELFPCILSNGIIIILFSGLIQSQN